MQSCYAVLVDGHNNVHLAASYHTQVWAFRPIRTDSLERYLGTIPLLLWPHPLRHNDIPWL